jgi:hypothetical protein
MAFREGIFQTYIMIARRAYSTAYRCQKGDCKGNGLPYGRIQNGITARRAYRCQKGDCNDNGLP